MSSGPENQSRFNSTALSPVAVVVDSRNVHGMLKNCLGVPGRPTRAGVTDALARYGFEVVDFAIAVGTRTIGRKPQGALFSCQEANVEYANKLTLQGSRVLEGILQPKENGSVEEKQVDVLCAVEIIRLALAIKEQRHDAVGVVLLSGDKDIEPAVVFAREEMSVPVLTAAGERIDSRGGDWLLLTEQALMDIAGGHTAPRGRSRRSMLAEVLKNTSTPAEWKTVEMPSGKFVFRNEQGLEAVLDRSVGSGLTLSHDSTITAWPVGVTERDRFPQLVLSSESVQANPNLLKEQVLFRSRATEAKFSIRSSSKYISTPPGYPLPGTSVLLQDGDPGAIRPKFIGEIEMSLAPPGGADVHLVRLVSQTNSGAGVVVMKDGRRGILKLPRGIPDPPAGAIFAAIAATDLDRGNVVLHPLSTSLPREGS